MTVNQPVHTLSSTNSAVISACGSYRYVLTRQVGQGEKTATFIMLNPSTADAMIDDPTIRRCIGFARRWACGRLVVLNLFAFRATKPAALQCAGAPVGPENKDWFDHFLQDSGEGPVVCAWGVLGTHLDQQLTVLNWLGSLGIHPVALGVTKAGYPKHPLYVPYSAKLVAYAGRQR